MRNARPHLQIISLFVKILIAANRWNEGPMEHEAQNRTSGEAMSVFAPPPHVVEQIRKQPECHLLRAVLLCSRTQSAALFCEP